MAYTDHCSVFGAVDEHGINLVVGHVMRQRPSLFNYGTRLFAAQQELLCQPIRAHPEVIRRGNPVLTIEDPLPVFGTEGEFGIDFCVQIVELEVDLHPGSTIVLPVELAPLGVQRSALHVRACAGILCPDREQVERYADTLAYRPTGRGEQPRPSVPLGGTRSECFCLDVFAVAHWETVVGPDGKHQLAGRLDGLEIVDIEPKGLENNLECVVATTLRFGVLPRLRIALETFVLSLRQYAHLHIVPTPTSSLVPANPAVEGDQVKVFLNVRVS